MEIASRAILSVGWGLRARSKLSNLTDNVTLFLLGKIMREVSDLTIENRGRLIRGARRSENGFPHCRG